MFAFAPFNIVTIQSNGAAAAKHIMNVYEYAPKNMVIKRKTT